MSNKCTILIVEPTQTEQFLYSEIFNSKEYELIFSVLGHEVLDSLAQYSNINLIITDLYLSDYKGIEWIEQLRKKTKLPILVVSSIPYKSHEIKKFNKVSAFYKPYSLTQLMNAVLHLVG